MGDSFERVWWVDVLQTFTGMLKTCPQMFVARWAGSYGVLGAIRSGAGVDGDSQFLANLDPVAGEFVGRP
jgi:hypothetical protein